MLTAISAYGLFTGKGRRYLVFTIVAGTLAVLSHPEAAVHTVGLVLLIWCFKARNKAAFFDEIIVALGVCAASAVWWLPVILQHGIAPFLNAAQTGNHSISAWLPLLTFSFTEEPLVQLIAVIGLIGLFITIKKRNFFFVAWFVLPFVMEPRSATWILTMPLAMLAAIACTDLLLPGLASMGADPAKATPNPLRSKIVLFFSVCILAYALLGSYVFALKMGADHLGSADEKAMDWISHNTPPESRFIILTGAQDPMHDPVQEWFPALTGRASATTLQGREWTWGKNFIPAIAAYTELQNCMMSTPECFEQKAQTLGIDYGYIYISTQPAKNPDTTSNPLIAAIMNSDKYIQVYEQEGIHLFQAAKK
jgi:hypothetical protein